MEEKKRARMNKKNKHADQGFEVVIDLPTEYQIWQYNHVHFLWRLLKVRERKRERERPDKVQRVKNLATYLFALPTN